jgi:hypothetical protein
MMTSALLPARSAEIGRVEDERVSFGAPELQPAAPPPEAPIAAVRALADVDFAVALKDALRDFHSSDLLARNPLLRDGICNLGGLAGPSELRALLSETVSTLFGNPRDEKLRRVIELTYFQPAPKQEAVADRLSLSFGTYRRHLSTARSLSALAVGEFARRANSTRVARGGNARRIG